MSIPKRTARLDRRENERRPYITDVIVMMMKPKSNETAGEFLLLPGQTRDISSTGVSFECDAELRDKDVRLLVKLPKEERTYVEADIVRAIREDGRWKYGARFQENQSASL